MPSFKLHFTKDALQKLSPPTQPAKAKGSVYDTYRDTKEDGLILLVGSGGSKTFYLYKKVNGRPERIKIGPFPDFSVDKARQTALIEKGKVAAGINPNDIKRQLNQEMTLGELFGMYMERYSRKHKRSWMYDEREIPARTGDWFKKKLRDISQQSIRLRMEEIHDKNGPTAANHFIQRLKAMFNKGIEWGWEGTNPVSRIKQYKTISRDRFLQPDELPRFFKALAEEREFFPMGADYILLSLFTGARKSNVLSMRWEDISLERAEWRIPQTKNGEPLTVTLSNQAMAILKDRSRQAEEDCPWVFPSPKENSLRGHFHDPKKSWERVLKASKIKDLHIHDLRRTLGSFQAATGANSYVIGKSLGHKDHQSTAIYARLNLDPVRQSVQKANDVMWERLNSHGNN